MTERRAGVMRDVPSRLRPFFWCAAALILLAGLGLRVWQLGKASLWYDEVLTETRAQASAGQFFTRVLESGNQTPLYFATLHLFPTGREFLLRLPSALAGAAGIALLMFVALRVYGNATLALVAGALLAFNPYHIWLSRTARPYALLFVFSLLASYFFLALLRGERSRANWTGFTLSSMAAYTTHYFAAALPLAQYILFAFILRGNRGFFRRWLRAQIVAGIPLAIWIVALLRRESVAFGIGWIPRPGLEDIPLTLWNMLLCYDGSLPWYLVPGLLAAALGLVPGLVYAVRERKSNRVDFYWFWLITAPLAAAFVASLVRPLYVDRYFMFFLPALLLLTARGWKRLPRPAWSVGLAVIVVVVGASSVVITLDRGHDQKEDWRAAAAYVERARLPGDGLLAEAPVTLVVFLRYFEDLEMPRAWLLEDSSELAESYDEHVQRVWAIYRNPNEDGHIQGVLPGFDPFAPGDSPMAGWLIERRDQVLDRKEFNGVSVLLVDVTGESTGVGN
jgi:mannosyltransferase